VLTDTIFTREEYLQTLGWSRGGFDQAHVRRDIAYAFGLERPARQNEYLAPDLFAEMLTSHLAVGTGRKTAAGIVREHWRLWLSLVQDAEADPQLYTLARPAPEQHFLLVGLKSSGHPRVAGGLMFDALSALSGDAYASHFGVSIERCLRLLRGNARRAKIALPPRLTVPIDHPDHQKWLDEINDYRQAAHARFEAKVARRAAKESIEPR
jgi:hypothetical protein